MQQHSERRDGTPHVNATLFETGGASDLASRPATTESRLTNGHTAKFGQRLRQKGLATTSPFRRIAMMQSFCNLRSGLLTEEKRHDGATVAKV